MAETTPKFIEGDSETASWDAGIYKIQEEDLVSAYNANRQATQLMHRVNFLKENTLDITNGKQLADSGYQRLPGGLLLQWCYGPNSTDGVKEGAFVVNFPTAFSQCFGVQVSTYNIQVTTNPEYLKDNNAIYQVISHDASKVTLMLQVMAGADSNYTDRYKPFIFALGI